MDESSANLAGAGDELAAGKLNGAGKRSSAGDQAAHALSDAVSYVSDAADRLIGQVRGAYDQACGRAKQMAADVDPVIKEKPYTALVAAAGVGLVLGLLMASRGPKVIYIKPRA
jgi:ElaB/YqjD/DUF883 family membrane-anchored ribosome-binding protein